MNIRFLFLPLLFLATGYAQPPGSPAGNPVTLRLRFLSMGDEELEDLWIRNGEEWVSPRAPSEYLATSLRYTGPAQLIFHRKRPDGEGGETMVPVGGARLDPDSSESILLLSRNEQGRVYGRSLDVGAARFPAGAYMVFNLCDRSVALGMAGELHTLRPEALQIVAPTVEGREPISVQFLKAGDPDRKSLVTTTWFHNPIQRQLVFLMPAGERIQVKSLTLFPESGDPSP